MTTITMTPSLTEAEIATFRAEGFVHHTHTGKKALDPEAFPEIVTPQAQAGDVVWFHMWAVHGSAPNVAHRCRRAVRVGYRTGMWA